MLNFKTVELTDKDRLLPSIHKYGEGSCRWSFVHLYKYRDSFAEHNNCIFLLKNNLCTENKRVYMMPFCEINDVPFAIQQIIIDAEEHNCALEFNNITNKNAEILAKNFPDVFTITKDRNYYEYMYKTSALASFEGSKYQTQRNHINDYNKQYANSTQIEYFGQINQNYNLKAIEKILSFQDEWLQAKKPQPDTATSETEEKYYKELCQENLKIQDILMHYKELDVSGIIISIDGKTAGYAFGAPNSPDCFDVIAEKGNYEIAGIYPVLVQKFAQILENTYPLINREEDIGIQGLRTSKLRYRPEYLLEKSIATKNIK